MTTRFESHVALDEKTRTAMVAQLNIALATTVDLSTQVKQAHWNVKGPQFFARHELFDALAGRLRGCADTMAERAATLGGYARGTTRDAVESSVIGPYDDDAINGQQHMRALMKQYVKYCDLLRTCAKETDGDLATQDLFIETLRIAELDLWFLESHVANQ